MHKVPILNAVLSEALPMGDGELSMCGQGDGGACTVLVLDWMQETNLTYIVIWSTCRSIRSR